MWAVPDRQGEPGRGERDDGYQDDPKASQDRATGSAVISDEGFMRNSPDVITA